MPGKIYSVNIEQKKCLKRDPKLSNRPGPDSVTGEGNWQPDYEKQKAIVTSSFGTRHRIPIETEKPRKQKKSPN